MLRWLAIYVVACYLTAPVFFLTTWNLGAALFAPVLIPLVALAVILTENGYGYAMAIGYLILYVVPLALLLPSAAGIVQNIRYGERSRWPYATWAILYPAIFAWIWWMWRTWGPWH